MIKNAIIYCKFVKPINQLTMDINTFSLLANTKSNEHFFLLLNSIAHQYENIEKYYHDEIINFEFKQRNDKTPEYLYKYIDFEGGLASLEHCSVQFTHPFSFRKDETNPLIDKTEFWFDRFYYDKQTLIQLQDALNQKFKNRKLSTPQELLGLLQIQFIQNTAERNKILCLSTNKNNKYLWSKKNDGICIEYKSKLFIDKNNFKELVEKKCTLISQKLVYVNDLVKYPVRLDEYSWIANLIFVKHKQPYEQEEEFRVVFTEDIVTDYKRKEKLFFFKNVVSKLSDNEYDYNQFRKRFSFDKSFINKVYYKSSVKDEEKLIRLLDRLKIKYEKI